MTDNYSDRAWEYYGNTDPYFAVLTNHEFSHDALKANKEKFFVSGELFIAEMIALLENHFPKMTYGRALDFGCGVGRLTLPLAKNFNDVVGIDIAPGMLREAQANALVARLGNVSFELCDDMLTGAGNELDYVSSCIVLQHIPVDRGMRYIDRMLALLRPGGVANLHFTINRAQGPLRQWLYWIRKNIPAVNNIINVIRGRPIFEPLMEMNEYPIGKVLHIYAQHGIINPLIMLASQGTTEAVYLIGQKP